MLSPEVSVTRSVKDDILQQLVAESLCNGTERVTLEGLFGFLQQEHDAVQLQT